MSKIQNIGKFENIWFYNEINNNKLLNKVNDYISLKKKLKFNDKSYFG